MFDDRMSAPIDFRKRYRQYVHIYVYIYPSSVVTIVTTRRRSFRFVSYALLPIVNWKRFCSKADIFIRTATQYRFYRRCSSILVHPRV